MAPQLIFALLLIILVAFIICIFLAWYFSHTARLKERLLLIEKGLNPDEFVKKTETTGSRLLKTGIVFIGLSIGLAIAARFFIYEDSYQLAVMGIFTGASMIIANYVTKAKIR